MSPEEVRDEFFKQNTHINYLITHMKRLVQRVQDLEQTLVKTKSRMALLADIHDDLASSEKQQAPFVTVQ